VIAGMWIAAGYVGLVALFGWHGLLAGLVHGAILLLLSRRR
jgi:hypothetical protein